MPHTSSSAAHASPQTFAFSAVSVVTTTVATAADAERLASHAVQERLAACAQVEAISSHYMWDGTLQVSPEWRLVFKTVPGAVQSLVEWLRSHHPYTLPQILMRGEQAQRDYASWVAEQVDVKRAAHSPK